MKHIFRVCFVVIGVLVVLFVVIIGRTVVTLSAKFPKQNRLYDFDSFDNSVGHPSRVAPNLVHYIIFGKVSVDFVTFLSVSSAIKVQRPDEIWIHSDTSGFEGRYWELLEELAAVEGARLSVKHLPRPSHVYGQPLSSVYHSTDVARIQVLIKFGGIYLDTDSLVLKPLDQFLNYEMVVGWPRDEYIGTQVLIGHKDARFLEEWLNGYRRYKPRDWYYNAGQYPTEQVAGRRAGLVHRVEESLGVGNLLEELYGETPWAGWKELHAVHLLSRHPPFPRHLDEYSLSGYNRTFGEIARWLLFETPPALNVTTKTPYWSR